LLSRNLCLRQREAKATRQRSTEFSDWTIGQKARKI
jgi:hypothetical protein